MERSQTLCWFAAARAEDRNEYSFWLMANFVRLDSCAVAWCQRHFARAHRKPVQCARPRDITRIASPRAPTWARVHKAYALNSWHAVAQPHARGDGTCLAPIREVQRALSSRQLLIEQRADHLQAQSSGASAITHGHTYTPILACGSCQVHNISKLVFASDRCACIELQIVFHSPLYCLNLHRTWQQVLGPPPSHVFACLVYV